MWSILGAFNKNVTFGPASYVNRNNKLKQICLTAYAILIKRDF